MYNKNYGVSFVFLNKRCSLVWGQLFPYPQPYSPTTHTHSALEEFILLPPGVMRLNLHSKRRSCLVQDLSNTRASVGFGMVTALFSVSVKIGWTIPFLLWQDCQFISSLFRDSRGLKGISEIPPHFLDGRPEGRTGDGFCKGSHTLSGRGYLCPWAGSPVFSLMSSR